MRFGGEDKDEGESESEIHEGNEDLTMMNRDYEDDDIK